MRLLDCWIAGTVVLGHNTVMTIIDGRKIAADVLERLADRPRVRKFLAAVLVGNDASSISFLKQKERTAQKLGVDFRQFQFPVSITKGVLRSKIKKIAADDACGGVIVQLPLPNRDDEQDVLNAIPPSKDVDVLGETALAKFQTGENAAMPPAIGTVIEVLNSHLGDSNATFRLLTTGTIAVVGAGRLVGKPIADWLRGKNKNLIVINIGDDIGKTKTADLVVSGAGVPGLITPDMLKEGAVVIDFGYGKRTADSGERIGAGDFDALKIANCKIENFTYTPTPGGTGPILVAKLFENFYALNGG